MPSLAEVVAAYPADKLAGFMRDVLPRLDPEARADVERTVAAVRGYGWRRDPDTFMHHLEPGRRQLRHQAFLAGKFRAAVTGEGARVQVWNAPQQTVKSTTLRWGCAWVFDYAPGTEIIYTSHSNDLARDAAYLVRDISRQHADKVRYDLQADSQRVDHWNTTQGGGMLAKGIRTGISGYHADGFICDDPLANFEEAHSLNERDRVWDEITSVARGRLAANGWFILAHARWHIDDPTGRMEQLAAELGVVVEFVRLPMLAEDDDVLGRAPGEPLVPELYDLAECLDRAKWMGGIGSYKHNAMEMQRPTAETGGELKRADWQRWPGTLHAWDAAVSSWDCKLKDKKGGDYTVGLVVARIGGRFYVLDMLRDRWSLAEAKVAMAWCAVKWPTIRTHVVENAGYGPEAMQELTDSDHGYVLRDELADAVGVPTDRRAEVEQRIRYGLTGLVPHSVVENKVVRARTYIVPSLAAHNIAVPETRFGDMLIDEAASFPPKSGGHDDIVDTLSQALKFLDVGTSLIAPAPTATVAAPSPSARALTTRPGTYRSPFGR